jgi:Uncharacterized protein conserved in bacteria (DUF2252)
MNQPLAVPIRSSRSSDKRPRGCPELVPIRYGRMLVSPFTFCREARIMADDLAATSPVWASGAVLRDGHGRRLTDLKGFAEIDQMGPDRMAIYFKLCGCSLARSHARPVDRGAIASYLGNGAKFDRTILEFSDACAEQNVRDWRLLVGAVNSGTGFAWSGFDLAAMSGHRLSASDTRCLSRPMLASCPIPL